MPQLPQLVALPVRSTHWLPHRLSRAAQAEPHTPWEQTRPVAQALPQPPQFLASALVSTQAPEQLVVPLAQAQTLFWQVCPLGQVLPHVPPTGAPADVVPPFAVEGAPPCDAALVPACDPPWATVVVPPSAVETLPPSAVAPPAPCALEPPFEAPPDVFDTDPPRAATAVPPLAFEVPPVAPLLVLGVPELQPSATLQQHANNTRSLLSLWPAMTNICGDASGERVDRNERM